MLTDWQALGACRVSGAASAAVDAKAVPAIITKAAEGTIVVRVIVFSVMTSDVLLVDERLCEFVTPYSYVAVTEQMVHRGRNNARRCQDVPDGSG